MEIGINGLSSILIALATLLNLPINISQKSLIKQMPQINKWQYIQEKEGMILKAQAFTRDEAKSFFKEDLVSKGYRPVIIQINNLNNKEEYIYSKNYIGSTLIDEKIITSCLSINMFPVIGLALLQLGFDSKYKYFFSSLGLGGLLLNHLISATIKKISPEIITIPPLKSVTTIIFIDDTEFNSFLAINILNLKTNTFLYFGVDLFKDVPHPPIFMLQ